MASIRTNLTIPQELMEQLDEKRGLIPRSTYVAELIIKDVEGYGDAGSG